MKISIKGMIAAVLVMGAGIPATGAAKTEKDGYLNGKPFAALNEKIEANSDVLASLQTQFSALNGSCDAIETDISDLKAAVAANTEGLEALAATTSAEFDAVKAQHDADTNAIKELIAAIEVEVDELTSQAGDLADSLSGALGAIATSGGAVDGLVLQVLGLNAQLTSINSSINGLSGDIDDLQDQLDAQAALLAQIQLQGAAGSAAAFSGVESIMFDTLNADCAGNLPNTFHFSVNGVEVATSAGDTAVTCSCNAPVTTAVADSSALAGVSFGADGTNTVSISRAENNQHAIAWSKATMEDAAGNKKSYCIFDHAGGDCTATDLCAAGYTFGAVDASVNF